MLHGLTTSFIGCLFTIAFFISYLEMNKHKLCCLRDYLTKWKADKEEEQKKAEKEHKKAEKEEQREAEEEMDDSKATVWGIPSVVNKITIKKN